MNILYCGDKGISRGILVSVLSILKHNKSPLAIYILTINYEPRGDEKRGLGARIFGKKPQKTVAFEEKTAKFLDKLVKKTNPKNFVKLIDATEVFVANLPEKNMGSYFTPCSMLRLYVDKISELPKDRLLYLDYDVVCRGDLAEFYETDLTDIEAAGVLDIYGKNFYRYNFPKTDYMNSGVMLFNMAECRKGEVFSRAAELCAKRWMMLADQAALNKVIRKRKLMPRKYNEQAERPKEDTVLHHFSNNFKFLPYFRVQKVKPFEVEKIHEVLKITEYDDILKKYEELKENL